RTLDWQGPKLTIIYIHDTRRIETSDDLKSLDSQNIKYTVIEEVRKTAVQKSPVDIGRVGTLRYLANVEVLSPTPKTNEDEITPFLASLKWIGGVGTSLLL